MRTLRPSHTLITSWIAALAVLMASWAPALGQALGLDRGPAAWVEVCTTQGSKWLNKPSGRAAGDTSPAPGAHGLFDHCAYCSAHAPVLGLPPAAGLLLRPADHHGDGPLAITVVPRTRHAWWSAEPRAPPRFG